MTFPDLRPITPVMVCGSADPEQSIADSEFYRRRSELKEKFNRMNEVFAMMALTMGKK